MAHLKTEISELKTQIAELEMQNRQLQKRLFDFEEMAKIGESIATIDFGYGKLEYIVPKNLKVQMYMEELKENIEK